MAVQITLLLAEIIYVEMMQSNVPIYDSYGQTPLILMFFLPLRSLYSAFAYF